MVTKHVNRQKVDTEKIEGHTMTYFYKHGSRVGLEINCIDSVEVALCFVIECSLDETQQYLRRDCLEITGVPITSHDNPKQLVKEIGTLIGAEIDDSHIAAAHRLPDSKNVKNRMIVKFLQRDKREEVFKKRKHLVGKNIRHLPSLQTEIGESISRSNKIFINESLTGYRKRLFGRIKEYKRKNNVKFLWTSNGKIMLKVSETSATEAFTTHEEFEAYLDQISNT